MQSSSAIIEISSPRSRIIEISSPRSSDQQNSHDQAQVAESASAINPSAEVAVESGVGSRSSSFRNLFAPFFCTISSITLGCAVSSFVASDRYLSIIMPENPSNTTLAYVSQYNQRQQEAINQHYQDTMIPIVAVGLGALAIQQVGSYLQRNSTIGPRRQMIEEQRTISADLVFNHPDTPEQTNSTNPSRPNSSVDSREGGSLISSPAQLQQARPTRYAV